MEYIILILFCIAVLATSRYLTVYYSKLPKKYTLTLTKTQLEIVEAALRDRDEYAANRTGQELVEYEELMDALARPNTRTIRQ